MVTRHMQLLCKAAVLGNAHIKSMGHNRIAHGKGGIGRLNNLANRLYATHTREVPNDTRLPLNSQTILVIHTGIGRAYPDLSWRQADWRAPLQGVTDRLAVLSRY